ncbi:carbohydrate porin [Kordiimonas sp.]|uniref:carbohydrate porin n=1 Tax=Kordiimonas sp. TaxID=1970157 RepID=UPI003A8F0669
MAEDRSRFEVGAAYSADYWTIARGEVHDSRYLDNLDLTLGWQPSGEDGPSVFLYGLYNNGAGFSSELAGDAQVISNIETPVRAARLYEAWVEQPFMQKRASIKLGLYDLNSEFDALESAGLFIASAHGIGTDISQTGQNGPSIFPITSLAARFSVDLSDDITTRFAVLDAVPGDVDHPKRTTIKLGGGEGALMIGELEYRTSAAKLLVGHWRYSADFETHDGSMRGGNAGTYIRGEWAAADDTAVFARLGQAEGRFNTFSRFYSGGISHTGIWQAADQVGLAIAWAEHSKGYQQANPGANRREVALELTYKANLTDWLSFQPDIQYVINPLEGSQNVLAVGLRMTAEVSWN